MKNNGSTKDGFISMEHLHAIYECERLKEIVIFLLKQGESYPELTKQPEPQELFIIRMDEFHSRLQRRQLQFEFIEH